jgi:hypothetical protein
VKFEAESSEAQPSETTSTAANTRHAAEGSASDEAESSEAQPSETINTAQ